MKTMKLTAVIAISIGTPGKDQRNIAPGEVFDGTKDLVERGWAKPAPKAAGKGEPKSSGPGVNMNSADLDGLQAIDGVGEKTAKDIVAARDSGGPFKSLADCAERVGGVGLDQLENAKATV